MKGLTMYRLTLTMATLNVLKYHKTVVSATCLKLPEPCLLQSHWNISSISKWGIFELDGIICDWQQHPQIQTFLQEMDNENEEKTHISRFLSLNYIPKCPLHILVNVRKPSTFAPILEMVYYAILPDAGILFINSCDTEVATILTEEAPTFANGLIGRIILACKHPETLSVQWSYVCPNCPESSEIIEPPLTLFHIFAISRPNKPLNSSMGQTRGKCRAVVHPSQLPECGVKDALFHILRSALNKDKLQYGNPNLDDADLQDIYIYFKSNGVALPPEELMSLTFSNTYLFLVPTTSYRFFYCIKNPEFFPPNWTTLLEPFDVYLWIGILLSVLFITVYVIILMWDKVSMSLLPFAVIDVLLGILSGSKCFSKKLKCVMFVSLVFLVIVNYYLGEVTSTFVTIPSHPQFKTVAEVLKNQYRLQIDFIDFQFGAIPVLEKAIGDPSLKLQRHHFIEKESNSELLDIGFVNRKAFTGISMMKSFSKNDFRSSQFVHEELQLKCFFLTTAEKFEFGATFIFRHNKAKEGAWIFQKMHESGLLAIWQDMKAWRGYQKKKSWLLKFKFGPQSFKALPLRSHIRIVFFLELIALGGAFGVWLGEIGWSVVIKRLRVTKVRKVPRKRFSLLSQLFRWLYKFVRDGYQLLHNIKFLNIFSKVRVKFVCRNICTNKPVKNRVK